MGYKNAEILTDKNGRPIPQKFDIASGKFVPETTDSVTNTQVTGSNVEDDNPVPVKQMNGVIMLEGKIGTIPSGGNKFVIVDFLKENSLVNNISIVGRNDSGKQIKIDVREGYYQSEKGWNTSKAFENIVYEPSSNVAVLTERVKTLSHGVYIYVFNQGDEDIDLTRLAVMLWS